MQQNEPTWCTMYYVSDFRATGVWLSSFCHSPGAKDRKLHECCECLTCYNGPLNSLGFCASVSLILFHLTTGWLRWQRNWLPHEFSVETSRYKSKQTRNESHALCCDGKQLLTFNIRMNFECLNSNCISSPQQAQRADEALPKFPELLKHIEAAAR